MGSSASRARSGANSTAASPPITSTRSVSRATTARTSGRVSITSASIAASCSGSTPPSTRTAASAKRRFVDVGASESLHRRVRAMVAAFARGDAMPEPFETLAFDLVRYQAAHVTGFGRLLGARGLDPAELRSVDAIPAVPTDAFKLTRVAAFPPEMATATFKTSGTTIGTRGVHEMRDASTYDEAAIAFGRQWLVRDVSGPIP